jgi:hypothetical protein
MLDTTNKDAFEEWRRRVDLILTPTKTPKAILANALIALRRAPEWQGVLAYDEFALVTKLRCSLAIFCLNPKHSTQFSLGSWEFWMNGKPFGDRGFQGAW